MGSRWGLRTALGSIPVAVRPEGSSSDWTQVARVRNKCDVFILHRRIDKVCLRCRTQWPEVERDQ